VCALCALARTLAYIHSLCTQSLTRTCRGEDRSFSGGHIALSDSHTRGGARARHARKAHRHPLTHNCTHARAHVTHTRACVCPRTHTHTHTHVYTHCHTHTHVHTHTHTHTHTLSPPGVTQHAHAHTHAHIAHAHVHSDVIMSWRALPHLPLSSCIATALDGGIWGLAFAGGVLTQGIDCRGVELDVLRPCMTHALT
jgi:hypothetical protein